MPQFVEMEQKSGGLIRGHLAARKQDAAAAARRASGARYDQFVAPKLGMTAWVNSLANKLPSDCIQLNQPVKALRRAENESWIVETVMGAELFDAVICSAPTAIAAELLCAVAPEAAAIMAGIPYASSAVVAMIVKRLELKGRVDGFGLIVPRKEGRETLAISYTSNKYPGRTPQDEILLRIFLGGALSPETVDRPDNQLMELATNELRRILGWTGKVPQWQALIRWRDAMPQYLVGHVGRMRQLDDYLAKLPTLKVCGAGYAGVGIPQCVRGGRKAANAVLTHFQKPSQS